MQAAQGGALVSVESPEVLFAALLETGYEAVGEEEGVVERVRRGTLGLTASDWDDIPLSILNGDPGRMEAWRASGDRRILPGYTPRDTPAPTEEERTAGRKKTARAKKAPESQTPPSSPDRLAVGDRQEGAPPQGLFYFGPEA